MEIVMIVAAAENGVIGAAGANHAVIGDRDDEDDFHQRIPSASAISAGPPSRQVVHSSIRTAPSDL